MNLGKRFMVKKRIGLQYHTPRIFLVTFSFFTYKMYLRAKIFQLLNLKYLIEMTLGTNSTFPTSSLLAYLTIN